MEAPFKVGQRVVAIRTSKYGHFKYGHVYNVLATKQCICGYHSITIGVISTDYYVSCSKCGIIVSNPNDQIFHGARNFAPIEESKERIRYVAVSETLREQAVEIAAIETN